MVQVNLRQCVTGSSNIWFRHLSSTPSLLKLIMALVNESIDTSTAPMILVWRA